MREPKQVCTEKIGENDLARRRMCNQISNRISPKHKKCTASVGDSSCGYRLFLLQMKSIVCLNIVHRTGRRNRKEWPLADEYRERAPGANDINYL